MYEAQILLPFGNASNYEELPEYDAMESVASPTEVGCYENLNPEHEESFIKESQRISLAFFRCIATLRIKSD